MAKECGDLPRHLCFVQDLSVCLLVRSIVQRMIEELHNDDDEQLNVVMIVKGAEGNLLDGGDEGKWHAPSLLFSSCFDFFEREKMKDLTSQIQEKASQCRGCHHPTSCWKKPKVSCQRCHHPTSYWKK